MTDRFDHAEKARDEAGWVQDAANLSDDAAGIAMATVALTHATLALVEQQRIANLIALAESSRATVNGSRAALSALYDGAPEDGTARMSLRPDIAAALGIEVPR